MVMKSLGSLFSVLFALSLAACGGARPVVLRTDPNEEKQTQMEVDTEQSADEAFICQHPELDEKTKQELRNGTVSRRQVMTTFSIQKSEKTNCEKARTNE